MFVQKSVPATVYNIFNCAAHPLYLCGATVSLSEALGQEQRRHKEEGAVSVRGEQINTTKHFGGGVNVSAGATL